MSDEFENLIIIAGLSVFGGDALHTCKVQDWSQIVQLASEQSVLPLVWQALKRTDTCPKEVFAMIEKVSQPVVINNYLKKDAIIEMLAQAEKENIRAYVIKGFVVAESYAVPDARVSVDTDILIDKEHEKAMAQFLEQHGFIVYPREKGNHHTISMHPQFGSLELHIGFFSDHAQETWFRNIDMNNCIDWYGYKQLSALGEYWTIDPTSHIIFLFLHMLNHFVNTGASLRMFFDIAAFYQNNYNIIDIEKLQSVIAECNGRKLFSVILGICEKYCVTDFKKCMDDISDDDLMNKLIDDLKNGGFMGMKQLLQRQLERNENTRSKVVLESGKYGYYMHKVKYYLRCIQQFLLPTWRELAIIDPTLRGKKYRYFLGWFNYVKQKTSNHYYRRKSIKKMHIENKRSDLLHDIDVLK